VISSHTCVSVVARNTTESQADEVTQPIFGSASKEHVDWIELHNARKVGMVRRPYQLPL
jgi:hypothetical protein